MENIEIIEPHAHDRAAVDDINRLLEQLTPSPERFTAERLAAISADGASRLWLLRVDGRVAGMLAMGLYTTPTGRKAWIEDVIVDEAARGLGIGERLVRAALERAAAEGVDRVLLTSRASRRAAHTLYHKTGFEEVDTVVFARKVDKP